jgi:hypothetical protein
MISSLLNRSAGGSQLWGDQPRIGTDSSDVTKAVQLLAIHPRAEMSQERTDESLSILQRGNQR